MIETYDKAQNAMKTVTGISQQIRNSLVACCSSGGSVKFKSLLKADKPGDFFEVRKKLETVFVSAPSALNRRLRTALDEMEGIIKLLGHIQIGRKIVFRPTLAQNAEVRASIAAR
jgi:hypothetical protein